jgi:acyl-coenzyme A synthetase/AMP-(fatty) acid ligase
MALIRKLIAGRGPEETTFSDPSHNLTRPEMAALVKDIQARIADAGLEGKRLALALESSVGGLALLVAAFETDCSCALIAKPAGDALPDWPAFCDAGLLAPDPAKGADSLTIVPLVAAHPAPMGQDQLYMRTSGTTGEPKWAVHRKASVIGAAEAALKRCPIFPEDRSLLPLPLSHMYGLGSASMRSLLAGSSIHIVPRGNPLELLRAARAFQPTVAYLVPSQCRSIMTLNRSLGQMRLVVLGGDRLMPAEAAAFEAQHGTIIGDYGSTETGALTSHAPDDPAEMRHGTSGPLIEGYDLALDDEDADPSAEGAQVLKLRHKWAMIGYCNAAGEMISQTPEIWPMGDMVRVHQPGGHIEVLGRADHAVKRDGLLVHVRAVESALSRARGVALCAVLSAGQTRRGQGLIAFVQLTSPTASTDEQILAHCRAELLAREVPDQIAIMQSLPLLPSGKVNRRALQSEAERRMTD